MSSELKLEPPQIVGSVEPSLSADPVFLKACEEVRADQQVHVKFNLMRVAPSFGEKVSFDGLLQMDKPRINSAGCKLAPKLIDIQVIRAAQFIQQQRRNVEYPRHFQDHQPGCLGYPGIDGIRADCLLGRALFDQRDAGTRLSDSRGFPFPSTMGLKPTAGPTMKSWYWENRSS